MDNSQSRNSKPKGGAVSDILRGAANFLDSKSDSSPPTSHTASSDHHPGTSSSDRTGFSDFLQKASSLLNSQQSNQSPHHNQQQQHHASAAVVGDHVPNMNRQDESAGKVSYEKAVPSAQLLFEAAKERFQKGDKTAEQGADMAKIAGATADLLEAASQYSNLDEGKYGDYIRKAQQYLESYEQKHVTNRNACNEQDYRGAYEEKHGTNSHASA